MRWINRLSDSIFLLSENRKYYYVFEVRLYVTMDYYFNS